MDHLNGLLMTDMAENKKVIRTISSIRHDGVGSIESTDHWDLFFDASYNARTSMLDGAKVVQGRGDVENENGEGKLDEAEAEVLYRHTLEMREHVSGIDHPDMLLAVNNLGSLLKKQGKLDEAEVLYQGALGDIIEEDLEFLSNENMVMEKEKEEKDSGKEEKEEEEEEEEEEASCAAAEEEVDRVVEMETLVGGGIVQMDIDMSEGMVDVKGYVAG